MIEWLAWDSEFFGRKMGVLTGPLSSPNDVARDLAAAVSAGYQYVQCRPPIEDALAVRTVEQSGFYLTDLGVTWHSEVDRYLRSTSSGPAPVAAAAVRLAGESDIPRLSAEAARLFPLSRFYHDPFFTEDEANRMHAAWMANSVKGRAADAVLMIPESGFVTCKLCDGHGEIVLIGVYQPARGRGAGRRLMTAAVEWFASRGIAVVRVKTQVKNRPAMNFYHRLGFDLQGADMTMGCILRRDGGE